MKKMKSSSAQYFIIVIITLKYKTLPVSLLCERRTRQVLTTHQYLKPFARCKSVKNYSRYFSLSTLFVSFMTDFSVHIHKFSDEAIFVGIRSRLRRPPTPSDFSLSTPIARRNTTLSGHLKALICLKVQLSLLENKVVSAKLQLGSQ